MKLSKLFKGLIIFQLLSVVAMVIVLPDDPVYEEAMGIIDIASLIYVLLWLASLVLLFRFKSSGRTLFTILVILGMLLTLGMPEYSVPTGNLYEMLVWFGGALDGAMLAILYLTNIKERFQKIQE
jgi:membrane-bound ClpP family serine protease